MKTRLFLFSLMLMAFASASAQYQRWWGFYDEDVDMAFTGTATAEVYNCAVSCPATNEFLNGATIHGVRFFLRDKTNVSDVVVWLSTSRPASADKADIAVVSVPQSQLVDYDNDHQMVEATLPNPYKLESGTVYVGFSFKIGSAKTEADKNPVVIVKQNAGKGAFLLRTSKSIPSWNELGALSSYGALALEMLISNPSLPQHSADILSLGDAMGVKGTPVEPTLVFKSSGFAIINSIDYELTVGGQPQGTTHLQLDKPIRTAGKSLRQPITVNLPATNGYSDYQLKIARVNGEVNEAEAPQMSALMLAVDKLAQRRSVVEEYTGTWCTNCPRGIVGMSNMERDYGDRFVGIAVHTSSDPMTIPAYSSLADGRSAPTCSMDRAINCDPYLGDILTDYHYHASTTFGRMLERVSEADLSLSASWADAAQTNISYTAKTTFHIDAATSDYALAFVLTADGLRGSTSSWYQQNGESGKNTYPDDDMAIFRNASNPVTDIEYNHVAIGGTSVSKGISGSITAPIVSGQQQTYSGTFSIAGNNLVQDKSRLHAIVLLINNATGQIVNAAKVKIGDSGATAIREATAAGHPTPQAVYDLQGRVVEKPLPRGIYIIDGRKVVVGQ